MLIFPILFLVEPVVTIFVAPPSGSPASLEKTVILPVLYMLLIAVVTPSTLAAYTIVGEREQGTLEPLLTTPHSSAGVCPRQSSGGDDPFGGAGLRGVRALPHLRCSCSPITTSRRPSSTTDRRCSRCFSLPRSSPGGPSSSAWRVSVRATEVRVAQQLGMLASFPVIGVIVLLISGVIHPTFSAALEFGAGLLIVDLLALRLVSRLFDRERLVTGAKASARD